MDHAILKISETEFVRRVEMWSRDSQGFGVNTPILVACARRSQDGLIDLKVIKKSGWGSLTLGEGIVRNPSRQCTLYCRSNQNAQKKQ